MEKLLWIDMEMTGLDVQKERILEVAALVTDKSLKVLDSYEQVLFQPPELLAQMDDWNQNHHKESGLLDKVPLGKPEKEVEMELCTFAKKHFSEPAILAGNSIGQDRLFIDRYMPELGKLLHYRMLDVTAWKIVFENFYGKKFKKTDRHRALEDIGESIDELKYYLGFITPL